MPVQLVAHSVIAIRQCIVKKVVVFQAWPKLPLALQPFG